MYIRFFFQFLSLFSSFFSWFEIYQGAVVRGARESGVHIGGTPYHAPRRPSHLVSHFDISYTVRVHRALLGKLQYVYLDEKIRGECQTNFGIFIYFCWIQIILINSYKFVTFLRGALPIRHFRNFELEMENLNQTYQIMLACQSMEPP